MPKSNYLALHDRPQLNFSMRMIDQSLLNRLENDYFDARERQEEAVLVGSVRARMENARREKSPKTHIIQFMKLGLVPVIGSERTVSFCVRT